MWKKIRHQFLTWKAEISNKKNCWPPLQPHPEMIFYEPPLVRIVAPKSLLTYAYLVTNITPGRNLVFIRMVQTQLQYFYISYYSIVLKSTAALPLLISKTCGINQLSMVYYTLW